MALKGWDIEPHGVADVLGKVTHQVAGGEGLAGEARRFGNNVKGAAEATQSKIITHALGEFFNDYSRTLLGMGAKTFSCVTGASKATKAYLLADREMAEQAQQSAIHAPAPRIKAVGQ
ncbi:DUF6507 family protein [Actinomadura sp. 9N215]|uniref:DUF6507 family protein n=1 Tax=Actinomadura sp. 9N215 TaxID=3375150 RepID=UPI0037A358DB